MENKKKQGLVAVGRWKDIKEWLEMLREDGFVYVKDVIDNLGGGVHIV